MWPKCKKRRHPSREMADAHLYELCTRKKHREHKTRLAKLNVYWCGPCGAFHVGHRR